MTDDASKLEKSTKATLLHLTCGLTFVSGFVVHPLHETTSMDIKIRRNRIFTRFFTMKLLSLALLPLATYGWAPLFSLNVGDSFPAKALSKWGLKGKTSVVYFFGADDAPSCKKQSALFDTTFPDFQKAGAKVVGVRNDAGDKGVEVSQTLVVDEDDEIRNEIGIPKDFFVLGGRETYVLNKKGEVELVFNNQFNVDKHVELSLDKVEELKGSGGGGGGGGFKLPDVSGLLAGIGK